MTGPPYVCDDCGLDLTLTPAQIRALRRFGNPVRRQPCTENADGRHRVSQEQTMPFIRDLRDRLEEDARRA